VINRGQRAKIGKKNGVVITDGVRILGLSEVVLLNSEFRKSLEAVRREGPELWEGLRDRSVAH
jgi:hypothetical protein